jgi:hypothetical protein
MGRARGVAMAVALVSIGTLAVASAPAYAAKSKTRAHHHLVTKLKKVPKVANVSKVSKLAQVGHGVFWECPATTTSLLVGVNSNVLHPGQTLNLDFIVKNNGGTPCNYVAPYSSTVPGTVSSTLQIGPCGSMGFQVEGPKHRDVWPGVAAFNCPALGFAQLQPGGTVTGFGTWNQLEPNATKRVPVGNYTLVVDGHFSFPLVISRN